MKKKLNGLLAFNAIFNTILITFYYLLFIFSLLVFITLLTGCNKIEANIEFESTLFSDQIVVDEVMESDALFAFRVFNESGGKIQEVFIWKNSTRREVRTDLLKILEKLDENNDKVVHININRLVNENSSDLGDWHESETSKMIIEFIFPSEFIISNETFYLNIMHMIIRLETLPEHGDTEVISIRTTTTISLNSDDFPRNGLHFVYN